MTTLKEQDACYRIVFKVRRVFGVMVVKWEELLDGTVQPGEGWTITATPVKDPFVKPKTEKTDAGGRVGFTLTAGKWTIAETLKTGWKPITPSQVTIVLDQYAKAGAMDPVVFKNLEPVCKSKIEVQKVGYGTDADGKEVMLGPLAGWKVTVSRADGTMTPVTKVTDGLGKAIFAGLPPGVYKVKETVQAGWEVMGDNPQTVIHRDCETTPVRIENMEVQGKLKISGRKLFKAWIPPYKGTVVGLPGWVITATLVGTDVATITQTDALGNYVFPEAQLEEAGMAFPGASIQVCEEDRDNWIHVTPECVTVTFPYPVPPDYTGAVANFTNQQDPPVGAAVPRDQPGCWLPGQRGGAQGPDTRQDGGQVWHIGRRAGEGEPYQECRPDLCRPEALRAVKHSVAVRVLDRVVLHRDSEVNTPAAQPLRCPAIDFCCTAVTSCFR